MNLKFHLLLSGADPYQASLSGIYPIDSAINAGEISGSEIVNPFHAQLS